MSSIRSWFSDSPAAASAPAPLKSPRSVGRRLFVPAKCVRIMKICKHIYKHTWKMLLLLWMIRTCLFMAPSSYPLKKKQPLFINFAFSLSISKKCCTTDDVIRRLRKKMQCLCGLTVHIWRTDERCHHRCRRKKMLKMQINKLKLHYYIQLNCSCIKLTYIN